MVFPWLFPVAATVKISIGLIMDVAVEKSPQIHEEVVLCPVGRGAEFHSLLLRSLLQLSDHIHAWTHFRCIPAVELCVVHGESIVMLRNRHDKTSTGLLENRNPLSGIKTFSLEIRYEILVAKVFMFTVGFPVIFKLPVTGVIHISGIPFVSKGRDRINTPMDENP